jgi:hypothetical protein
MRKKRSTDLYVTAAESLGTFLFSPANSKMTIACAASHKPRRLGGFCHGLGVLMFEFSDDRAICFLYEVSGWPFLHRKRVDMVLAPSSSEGFIHVLLSADGRPPIFDADVPLADATKDNLFYLGQP